MIYRPAIMYRTAVTSGVPPRLEVQVMRSRQSPKLMWLVSCVQWFYFSR